MLNNYANEQFLNRIPDSKGMVTQNIGNFGVRMLTSATDKERD